MADIDETERRLRSELGLGLWRFPGDVGAHLPLADRQYIELYGPLHPLWRLGWLAWSVAVDALDDWIARLNVDDCRSFGDDPTKTFTPWRGRHAMTRVSRDSGGVIPYLIEYDRSVDLEAIFTAKHLAARHDAVVGRIRNVLTDGGHITNIVVDPDGADVTLPLP